jgi:hypothetical protein
MSARELNKGEPILRLFAPAGADTATFCQPAERALHDPTTGRVFMVIWYWLWQRFASAPTVADVALVVGLRHQLVDVSRIICFVQAQVLFACWSGDNNREDEVVHRPFIVLIGTGDVDRQWRPSFVDQDMDLGPTLASVCWITPRGLSAQRRGDRFAVNGLPLPADSSLARIETNQAPHNLLPDTLLLPRLKSLVQHTAGDAEPLSVNSFPLATSPQHIPDAIDDSPVVGTRSTRSRLLWRFGQMYFDAPPERAWNAEVIDILWLCATLCFVDDAPRKNFVLSKTILYEVHHFFMSVYFSDRF